MSTLYDGIGEAALRRAVETFYDRVFDDVMIGFMFRGRDKARLVEREIELAGEHLGGPFRYRGRPLAEVHAKLPIMGGHFERRLRILEDVLREQGVAEPVREAWLAHTRALRSQVTKDVGSECDHGAAAARAADVGAGRDPKGES